MARKKKKLEKLLSFKVFQLKLRFRSLFTVTALSAIVLIAVVIHVLQVPRVQSDGFKPPAKPKTIQLTNAPALEQNPQQTPKTAPTSKTGVVAPPPVVTPAPNSNVDGLVPTGSTPSSVDNGTQNPTTYTSTNWSGYFATGGNFTSVSGSWVVPNATGVPGVLSAEGTWVGIGGVTSGDLIQVGTTNTISPDGHVSTSAFYEMLPSSARMISSVTVRPGDSITASVSETSLNVWIITLTNNTTSQTFSQTFNYTSSHSSAEWIQEDPSFSSGGLVPFANFGSVTFTGARTTVNGSSVNLIGSQAARVILVNQSGTPLATPTAISGGSSFTVNQ